MTLESFPNFFFVLKLILYYLKISYKAVFSEFLYINTLHLIYIYKFEYEEKLNNNLVQYCFKMQ